MNIDELENFEQIGEGGMAAVWKAHQTSLDREVAVKIFRTELTSNAEKMSAFMQETKAAASLKHPNIIPIYDSIEHEGAYYFVMEYVNGHTSAELLGQGPMPWKRVVLIAQSMAEALEYAQKTANLIHRNIKPANIIISDDGIPKLADLGLTVYMDTKYLAEQLQVRLLEFPPNFMSPEQCRSKTTFDCRTDMYSLGATLYHMITGVVPFGEFPTMQVVDMHINGHLPNPRDVQPSTPLGLAQLIARLMMKDPNDRYASWGDAIKDIKKVLAGRVLAVKQGRSAPDSTISPATKKVLSPQSSKALPEPDTVVVPIWARGITWSVLCLWWAYTVFMICRLPPIMPPPPVPPEPKKAAVVAKPVTAVKPVVAQVTKPDTQPDNGKATNGAAQSAQSALDVSNEEMILLHSLRNKLSECIMSQNFNEAIAYIAQEKQYTHSPAFDSETDKMERYINALSGQGSVIEAALKKNINRSMSVTVNGTKCNVTVKGVENGTVRAEMQSTVGSATILKPINIQISQIDPVEQIALIGPADTEAKCIAIFGLSMRSRDYKLALKAAEKCGPFAELFKSKVAAEVPAPQ